MNESEYVALSFSDVERIETDLHPKAKRTTLLMSAVLMGLCLVMPFFPGRRSRPLVETMGYPAAVLMLMLIFGCFVIYVYIKSVIGLRADLRNRQKCVFKTRILRKGWTGTGQFELKLDSLPKALSRNKFIYPAAESHCFHEGDVVVLEYLERSAVLLRVFAEV
jgi:hypothetical protein